MTRAPEKGARASLIKTTSQKHRWCKVTDNMQRSRSIKERLHGAASHHISNICAVASAWRTKNNSGADESSREAY